MDRSLGAAMIVLLLVTIEVGYIRFPKRDVFKVEDCFALDVEMFQSGEGAYEASESATYAVLESGGTQSGTLVQDQSTLGDQSYYVFYGKVIESATKLPLPEADIVFWNGSRMFATQTDVSGSYAVNVTGGGRYQVYAYRDHLSTLGFDYIPACKEVQSRGGNLPFVLIPGASIQAKGDLRFFETLQAPTVVNFTIIHRSGLRTNSTSYDEGSIMGQLLNLRGTLLFVPCDIPIKIEASIYYSGGAQFRFCIDDGGDFLIMRRGDLMSLDLEKQLMMVEVESCYEHATSTLALVGQAERLGFYVRYEMNELLKAKNLLDTALSAITREAYDEAFADLREAYFVVKRMDEGLPSMYLNASVSTLFITPFLCFSAMATAAITTEKRLHFLAVTLFLYGFLLLLLYLYYPGYVILGASKVVPLSFVSFLVVYSVVTGLPYAFKERTSKEGVSRISAIIMAFSLSIKNLRRRKLRTFLTLTLMLISVFGFIALTSFSLEYGLLVERGRKAQSVDGFLIRKQLGDGDLPYDSIQPETYSWLQGRTEVTVTAPKIENIVKDPPLGHLFSPSSLSTYEVWGIVGIVPSQEAKVTGVDRVIVRGSFLNDEDLNGILISELAAKALGVEIGDVLQLFNQSFTLTGIFGAKSFERLQDVDGNPFAPYMPAIEGEVMMCPGEVVTLMHQKTAEKLPDMVLSRVFVQTRDIGDMMALARQLILKWAGIEAWVFSAGEANRVSLGSYYLAGGFVPALVPLALAALNIKVLMGSVVDERKREVTIMSSLGLNPFHITALFLAEALTIGVLAGSLGYLLGISSYHFMTFLPFSPLVKHKVESIWGILAVFSSITAALLGSGLPAIRSSVIVTPSMIRKWRIEEKPGSLEEPWVLSMPIRLRRENLDGFFTFVKNRLDTVRGHGLGYSEAFEDIREIRKGSGPASRGLSFVCFHIDRGVTSENELTSVQSMIPYWYVIRLSSKTRHAASKAMHEYYVWKSASVIRHLVLLYTAERAW